MPPILTAALFQSLHPGGGFCRLRGLQSRKGWETEKTAHCSPPIEIGAVKARGSEVTCKHSRTVTGKMAILEPAQR